MMEIIENVQKKCGRNFPIIARVTGCDYDSDGLTLEEGILHAKMYEQAGVAALHVVGGSSRNILVLNGQYEPRGFFIPIAEAMKAAGIKIPIILDGGFTTPDIAEKALAEGKADYIGLGRPTLADTEWANKAKEGRPEDIVPCIRCLMGCTGSSEHMDNALGIRCSVNPRFNLSSIRKSNPVVKKKKVCVIGGGPGGMEAARHLAVRGHEVTLYEQRKLGGTMHEASFDYDTKGDIQFLINYYITQMKKLDINIIYEKATAESILGGGFNVVIDATGAPPITSRVPGSDKKHVIPILEFAGNKEKVNELGDTILVVGGCFFNVEIAYSLAKKGKTVLLSSRRGEENGLFEVGKGNCAAMQQRLVMLTTQEYPVDYRLMLNLVEITDDGTIFEDTITKEKEEIKCDNIILCRGFHGESNLYKALDGKVEIHRVGDCQMKSRCTEDRTLGNAIHEGWVVANRI
jgi:NADPH-dependent 2,4-dienoyl-CoA reductase/sulfur reductase-like enzyme